MADTFGDLDTTVTDEAVIDEDIMAMKIEYDKIFLNVYNTVAGKKLFDTLRERHVDVPMYNKGDSLEVVSYRQGMSDLVTQMEACVEDALNPHSSK